MAFKMAPKGQKTGGREKGVLNKATKEIRALLDAHVDFEGVIKKLVELVEGVTVKGENGVIYNREPCYQSAKLLLGYRFGNPKQDIDITSAGGKMPATTPIIRFVIEQPTLDSSELIKAKP